MHRSEPQYPFLEKGLVRPLWELSSDTCTRVDADEFALSTDKSPPKLIHKEPPPPAPKPPPVQEKPKHKKGFLDLAIAFQEWKNRPPEPKPAPPPATATIRPRVNRFDLQDIPDAMDSIGWPVAANLQRRWFGGALNYANTDDGAVQGINQDGKPFPPSMIDTTTCTLDWILRFPRAKAAFEQLATQAMLFSTNAQGVLKRVFSKRANYGQCLSTWKLCNGNFGDYHKNFQFQLIRIDSDYTSKSKMFAKGVAMPDGLWMDDLYGALGAFTFNAAVDSFSYTIYSNGQARLEIYGVSVYARDVFTFHDRADEKGTQYLGHWNKTGFIVIPESAVAGERTKSDGFMYPVAVNNLITERKVYYPVRNKDYRNWQIQHNRGGDFIIYSDRRSIPLAKPFVLEYYP